MTCMKVKTGPGKREVAIVCVGDPEVVTMANGRKLTVEWHSYFGPSVEMKNGNMRDLTLKELDDPNIKAWIKKKGGAK